MQPDKIFETVIDTPIVFDELTQFSNLIVPYSKCHPKFNAKVLEQCHLDRDNETRSGSLAGNIYVYRISTDSYTSITYNQANDA